MFNFQNYPFLLQTIDLDWDEQPMPLGNLTVCIIERNVNISWFEAIFQVFPESMDCQNR